MEAAVQKAQAKKRRHTRVILTIATFLLVLIGGAVGAWFYIQSKAEEWDRQVAQRLYDEGQYKQAAVEFGKIAAKYPESSYQDEYRFWQNLATIRSLPRQSETKGAFDRISTFIKEYGAHPLFAEHGQEVGDALRVLLENAAKLAKSQPNDTEAQADFDRGRAVLDELLAINAQWVPRDAIARIDEERKTITTIRQENQERLDLIARLKKMAEQPSAESVLDMRKILHDEAAKPKHLDQDAEVKQAENEIYKKHYESVRFNDKEEIIDSRMAEDRQAGLVVQPFVGRPSDDGPKLFDDRIVLAMARGVLYALSQSDGQCLWAMRVGIDTQHLPVRVPAFGETPEQVLVLSADTLTLTGVDIRNGGTLWRHHVGAASLGRPVVIGHHAYLATLRGDVQEIDLTLGVERRLLGSYPLGQSVSRGGTRFGDTKLLFFAGDEGCVYVLDVAKDKHTCEGILYTEHEPGSLRAPPIVLPSEDDPAIPGYLVLLLTEGADGSVLRTFRLIPPDANANPGTPAARMHAEPAEMPVRHLRGWPWFPPYTNPETDRLDPEKLVLVTDAGVLGLFGTVQARNKDAPIFPLVREKDIEEGTIKLPGPDEPRGRAQVVCCQGNDLWVLARGRLMRYLLTFDDAGQKAVRYPSWGANLNLGFPIHESWTDQRGTTLFVTTLAPNGQGCLTTAVDAESGAIRWQRQLGLVCRGDPHVFGGGVAALDQAGGLFQFGTRTTAKDDFQWRIAGQKITEPLSFDRPVSAQIVAGPDGQSLYEFACPTAGGRLIVREYRAGVNHPEDHGYDLLPPLAGTPAVGKTRILLPMADGTLRQLRLPLGKHSLADGPAWRGAGGGGAARGHVVWLGRDDFLATDGREGIHRFHMQEQFVLSERSLELLTKDGLPDDVVNKIKELKNREFDAVESFEKELAKHLSEAQLNRSREDVVFRALQEVPPSVKVMLQLDDDIAGAPVVVARTADGIAQRVSLADVRGTVYLYNFDQDALKLVRKWSLNDTVTAGPFVRGDHIGVVMGESRLVWLDPNRDKDNNKPAWTWEAIKRDGAAEPQRVRIVGEPQIVEGVLLVADVSGRFVGLDPGTGKELGPGFRLVGSVGPSAAPVGYGAGMTFAPLSDGTVLPLPLQSVREPLPGLPPVW